MIFHVRNVLNRVRYAMLALAIAAAPTAAAAGEWQEQPAPDIPDREEILEGVVALSPTDAWAVGRHWGFIGSLLEFRTYILHWDGFAWSQVPGVDPAGSLTKFLQDVAARSPSDVWVAGWYRTGLGIETTKTLIGRWDGTAWTIVPSPNPGPSGSQLQAITMAGDTEAWAVGTMYNTSVVSLPLAMRWDGTEWLPVDVPVPPFCVERTNLTDIAARRSNRVLLTGYCKTAAAGDQGFILRWNGIKWRLVAGPGQVPPQSQLESVTFVGANEAWAVGAVGASTSSAPLIMHWDGAVWTVSPPPASGSQASLRSVDALGFGNVWAVGTGLSSQPPFAGRLTIHWNGTEWTREPAGDFGSLNGVSIAARHTWAVGQNLDKALILHRRN